MSPWTIAFIIVLLLVIATFEFGALVSLLILLAMFLVGLVVFGAILARAQGWKVWLIMLLLALYGVAIILVLIANEVCSPVNRVAIAEVNSARLLLLLAVVCLAMAATLVRRRAYAFAVVWLAVPPLISIPVAAIIHFLFPGERICAIPFL
jgi:hypothetical protein